MEPHTTNRAEAERLLGVSEKLLRNKDYSGCKDFALLAQENEPCLEGSDQILAVAEVLLASATKIHNHRDWYAILQFESRNDDPEQIRKQYRRLALLLHPDKNKFVYADAAFALVADAWAVLSDPSKKALFDSELSLYRRVDLVPKRTQPCATEAARGSEDQSHKLPARRNSRVSGNDNNNENSNNGNENENSNNNNNNNENNQSGGEKMKTQSSSFWSVCPYCYNLYEYERAYVGCCLRCENCERAFTAVEITQMPPLVPGKNAYYCCWGFFPMGFVMDGKRSISTSAAAASGFPNWMPPMFSGGGGAQVPVSAVAGGGGGGATTSAAPTGGVNSGVFVPVGECSMARNVTVMGIPARGGAPMPKPKPMPRPVSGGPKKRGRPRKNPL